jgi:hypothetical protein
VLLGDGANDVNAPSFATSGGDVHVIAGNGDNDIDTFDATLGANLRLDLGNGANSFTFGGTLNGGTLTSNTGNGADSITLGGTGPYVLKAHLGSGLNTLTFDASQFRSTDIEIATHTTPNNITQNGTFQGPTTLVNYP